MTALGSIVRACSLVALLAFLPLSKAAAQGSGIHFDATFDLSIDCDQPKELRDVPVHGHGTGVINGDGSSSADLTISAITASDIHFDGHLGGASQPAPGGSGTSALIGGNRVRLTWDLPNNQIITTVKVSGQSCTTLIDFKLKYGNRQYSLFDGQSFYFCSKPKLVRTSCEVH